MYHSIKNLNLSTLAGAFLLFTALTACNKLAEVPALPQDDATTLLSEEQTPMGSISLDVALEEVTPAETKAISTYQTVETYEKAVNQIDVFVFDKTSGKLNAHFTQATPTVSNDKIITENIPCTQGTKHVFVIINGGSVSGLSSVTQEDDLNALTAELSYNSKENGGNFVMLGRSSDLTVSSKDTPCNITARRMAYRVVLQKVKNETQIGGITIKGVFLINAGKTAIVSQADATNMPKANAAAYNIAGKKTGSSAFITSESTSDLPELLFQDLNNTAIAKGGSTGSNSAPLARLYGFPHSAHDTTPERLVLLATVAGSDYYYPMTLPATLANNTYTVELTIRNIGSQDPNVPVLVGDVDISVTLSSWTTGNNLELTI